MDNSLIKKIQETLTTLHQEKSDALTSLFCDKNKLGYDYVREEIPYWNWTDKQREKIETVEVIAMHKDFRIIWVKLNSDYLKRSDERIVINKINSEYPYNLTIFSNVNETQWDFVNVKLVREEVDDENKDPKKRKIVRRITVEEGAGLRTASERIAELVIGEDIIPPIELQSIHDKAFDIEKVTKEFFIKIAEKFMELVGGKRKFGTRTKEFEKSLTLPGNQDETKYKEFTVRLIGRLLFCWFLKKKKSKDGKPLLSDEVLSSTAVNENYYHQTLEPLFFEVLNTEINERKDIFRNEIWDITPFLNGGLFEPHDDDFYEHNFNTSKYVNTLKISDNWFKELFQIFESYNFTIDENTSIDIDLSIDPEMLGKIFENLLAEINPETGKTARKATGSYYTPRPIVEFMVDESLKQYLKQRTSIDENTLSSLLSYTEEVEISESEQDKIIRALDSIKILDPACGSGAFPMGILQKMLLILQKVDQDSKKWMKVKLQKIEDPLIRNALKKKIKSENWDYVRKLGIIQNSIFGVDVQQIAVEISKLRFFLSLIVDEDTEDDKENRGVIPLPNLEFKFVAANTLIGLKEKEKLLHIGDYEQIINTLKRLRNEYFTSYGKKKEKIEDKFRETQKKLAFYLSEWQVYGDKAVQLANWNPFSHESSEWFEPKWMFGINDGFDIVIGNPPYVQLQKESGRLAEMFKNCRYETFKRTGDIYVLFYEKGINVLKKDGHICLITSNKWMRAGYGDVLRNFFSRKNPKKLLDFGGFKVFEAATVDTNIILVQNAKNQKSMEGTHFKNDYNKGDDIQDYTEKNKVILENLTSDPWFIGNKAEINLKKKIEEKGIPLKNWDVNIYRGVLTGCNEAFIIDEKKRAELITKDPKSEEIIKPILRGRDIKRYGYNWPGLWLIDSHNGYVDEIGNRIPPINIENYPIIKEHLNRFWYKIEKRQDKGVTPYNLRNCAYYTEFEKEKVVWFYDNEKFYTEATGFLMAGKNVKYICGLLNSKPVTYFFKNWYAGGGLGEEGYRYKKAFLEKLPIPPFTTYNKGIVESIERLVEKILFVKKQNPKADTREYERQIDQLVYQLYELTEEEIKIVEGT